MKKQNVFISFSSAEKDWAQAFARALTDKGWKVWLDADQVFLDQSINALEKGLRASDLLVFVMTPENVRRPNLVFELGAAVSSGKRIVPIVPKGAGVFHGEVIEMAELPFRFSVGKTLRQESPEATAEKLAESLTRVTVNGGTAKATR